MAGKILNFVLLLIVLIFDGLGVQNCTIVDLSLDELFISFVLIGVLNFSVDIILSLQTGFSCFSFIDFKHDISHVLDNLFEKVVVSNISDFDDEVFCIGYCIFFMTF